MEWSVRFPLPERGMELERTQVRPSFDELWRNVLWLFKSHRLQYLKAWIELMLEKKRGEAASLSAWPVHALA